MAYRLIGANPLSKPMLQCWVIVSWTFRNKLKWFFNRNTKFFIHGKSSENIICEIAAILSIGTWVNRSPLHYNKTHQSEKRWYFYWDVLYEPVPLAIKRDRLWLVWLLSGYSDRLVWTLGVTRITLNTLRPRQMAAIFQTTFSNAFSWMKIYQFRLRFHWSLLPRVKLTIIHSWFR